MQIPKALSFVSHYNAKIDSLLDILLSYGLNFQKLPLEILKKISLNPPGKLGAAFESRLPSPPTLLPMSPCVVAHSILEWITFHLFLFTEF